MVVLGNAGSGKTTLACWLELAFGVARLDLDTIVWRPGAVAEPRPLDDVVADLAHFAGEHATWVVEGCYGDLARILLPRANQLVLLDPGEARCLQHNRERPWEPHKYASAAAQQGMLPLLLDWASGYYARADAWSLRAHREIFDGFTAGRLLIEDIAR